jgi:hypothetical protein
MSTTPETLAPREVRSAEQAEQEDVFFGQTVIIWARWAVILAGTVLAIWTSSNVSTLVQTIPFFLALIAMNFFLHGRYVMGSPLNRAAVIGASLVDLVLITAIIVFWPSTKGVSSGLFVLYYPVVFAFALVFPRLIEAAYTVLAMIAYVLACFVVSPAALFSGGEPKTIVMRLIVMAAMGFLGNYYFRLQRDRLRRASTGAVSAMEELRARVEAQTRIRPRVRRAG